MSTRITLKKKSPKNKRTYRPRRIWTVQQKLDLLALASRAETSMSSIAREFDVDVRLLFQWRRDLQQGLLAERTWGEPRKRQQAPSTPPPPIRRSNELPWPEGHDSTGKHYSTDNHFYNR